MAPTYMPTSNSIHNFQYVLEKVFNIFVQKKKNSCQVKNLATKILITIGNLHTINYQKTVMFEDVNNHWSCIF